MRGVRVCVNLAARKPHQVGLPVAMGLGLDGLEAGARGRQADAELFGRGNAYSGTATLRYGW